LKIDFNFLLRDLDSSQSFKYYSKHVRPYLKTVFPPDTVDGTTIIDGIVLNPEINEHNKTFHKVLRKFEDFGPLKDIHPHFKSQVFEEFMKESRIQKEFGQYFTPRNIIDAMIEISDIDKLDEGSEICDPACGVGGFILEPMKLKDNGVNFYYRIDGNKIVPKYGFHGFDIGFEKEQRLTIILAKANMLIFISELLKKNPALLEDFAKLFNSTFKLLNDSILGTLAKTEPDKYDLILTNPPYVTSGSSNYKSAVKDDARFSEFYSVSTLGIEGLFLQWVVKSLKPSKKAFVIIPDGILNRLNDDKLREFVRDECIIDGIISLPKNSFYRNPKKTYILAITKKVERSSIERKEHKQTEPVFSYLVSNTGETLDVKRFPKEENDLLEVVSLFNQFKGAKKSFRSQSKRCKIQPIDRFDPTTYWSIDRWWTKDEKIDLGIEEEGIEMSRDDFIDLLKSRNQEFSHLIDEIQSLFSHSNLNLSNIRYRTISLSDSNYFKLSIGKRVTQPQLRTNPNYSVDSDENHRIPIYSANVFKPFGYCSSSNISDFDHSYVIWGIDGNFDLNLMHIGNAFATTDHCGYIKILDNRISPEYLQTILSQRKYELGFDRSLRASLENVSLVDVDIPVNSSGKFDVDAQIRIISHHQPFNEIQQRLEEISSEISGKQIKI
jgi:type I restriction enzyme M protein